MTFLMYHYGAMSNSLATLFNERSTLVFPSKKLDVIQILESLETYKCNIFSGLPKIVNNVVNHPQRKNYDLSSVIVVGCAGQLPSADLITQIKNELGALAFFIFYGSTESNGGTLNIFPMRKFDPATYQNCVGLPYAYMESKIVDPETGRIVPLNVEGELHVRSFSVTYGYWNDEEKTREAIDANGW
jgi:fatty-acyl-CoA synthase